MYKSKIKYKKSVYVYTLENLNILNCCEVCICAKRKRIKVFLV